MKTSSVLSQLLFLAICLASCKEDTLEVTQHDNIDAQIILDENMLNSELDEIYRISDEAIFKASTEEGREGLPTFCALLYHDREARTIALDFGEHGCTDHTGKHRKGRLMIQYLGVGTH